MLQVVDLQCTRGDRRLFSGLAFELAPGELMHLHGHNGSGKTTLMRALCGLVTPTKGEVLWRGRPIRRQRDEYHAELLYLGHKNAIKEDLTAVENLMAACRLAGADLPEAEAWRVLERMGLRGHEDLPSRVLSQGQQKRVALARLLVSRAPLWLLDEPFVGLDAAAVAFLQSVIRDHVADGGLVVLTTHQEVALTGGRVKRLQLGWKEAGRV